MPLTAQRIYDKKGGFEGTLLMDIERGKVFDIISPEETEQLIKQLKGEDND